MRKLKELYNPELKNEYIEKSNSPVNSRQLLRKTSDFERLFDRDLCQFTFEQYDALLKNTSYNSNSYSSFRSAIKKYVDWCVQNDKTDSEQINIIKQLYAYKPKKDHPVYKNTRKYYKSANEVFDVIETLLATQDIDKHTVDRVCCTYALALEQITPTEMCDIKRSDVDLKNHEFTVGNRKYPITERAYQYFSEVYYGDKLYVINSSRCNPIKDGEYFFRTTRASQVDIQYFMNIHNRIIKGTQNKLPIGNELRMYDLGYANIINNKVFIDVYNITKSEEFVPDVYLQCARSVPKGVMTVWDMRNRYDEWYNATHN